MNKPLLIFDLDETLINSLDAMRRIFTAMAEKYAPSLTFRELHDNFRALAMREMENVPNFDSVRKLGFGPFDFFYSDLEELPFPNEDIREFRERTVHALSEECHLDIRDWIEFSDTFQSLRTRLHTPVDGADKTLSSLGEYRKVVLTNGFTELQREKHCLFGLEKHFDAFFASEMAGVGKPNSLCFQYVLEHTGVEPKDAVMIGDNLKTDILGAVNSGIRAVFFNRYEKVLPPELPAEEITSLRELPALLEKNE